VALVGFELAYVLAANLALTTNAIARAVGEPGGSADLHYEGAWSLVPGQVGFRRARFVSQDSSVQWQVEVERGSLWVGLGDLMRRQISLRHVRGEGVSFRFRHRVSPEGARRPAVAAFAPVLGVDDPPLLPDPPPPDSDPSSLWSVHLDDVDADVRELWVQEFHYEGPAHVRGAFQLAPKRRVWVGPAELALSGGALRAGEHLVATGLEGLVRADVPAFDVQTVRGLDVLHQISGRIDLDAQVAGLSFLALYGPPGGVALRDGSGQLTTRLGFARGTFDEGSSVRFTSSHLVARRGSASVVFGAPSAVGRAEGGGATLAFDVPFASLWAAGERDGPVAWAQGVRASAAFSSADVAALPAWAVRAARFDVDAAGADDLARVHELAGRPEGGGWALRGGRARASVRARAGDGGDEVDGRGAAPGAGVTAAGEVRARVDGLELVAGGVRWSGNVSLDASLGPFAPGPGAESPARAHVEGRDVAFEPVGGGAARRGWWFALDAPGARTSFAEGGAVRAPWALRARDLSPLTTVLGAQGDLPQGLAAWFDLEGVSASGGVTYARERFELDLAAARAGGLSGRGRYVTGPRAAGGAFRIAAGPLAVGVRLRAGEKADLAWPVGEGWLDEALRALGAVRR
jgi:hypothetical protein